MYTYIQRTFITCLNKIIDFYFNQLVDDDGVEGKVIKVNRTGQSYVEGNDPKKVIGTAKATGIASKVSNIRTQMGKAKK